MRPEFHACVVSYYLPIVAAIEIRKLIREQADRACASKNERVMWPERPDSEVQRLVRRPALTKRILASTLADERNGSQALAGEVLLKRNSLRVVRSNPASWACGDVRSPSPSAAKQTSSLVRLQIKRYLTVPYYRSAIPG